MSKKPKLVIVTGRPGAGKTTLSKKLGELLNLPVLSRDEFKEGYVNTFQVKHSKLPEDTNKVVTDAFFEIIELMLSKNVSLIAEAAFQHSVWETLVEKVKDICDMSIVICEVDSEVAAKRHLERGLEDSSREYFHGDNRVSHYKKTGEVLAAGEYSPPKFSYPTIVVSTADEYSPSLDSIKDKIFSR
ncbi:MAG: AAA family ATPase [Candidatus Jacksonbacteria bacterium]|nr:AAA family ATPase [Candidatus Jacksonbacteria bacterium]MBT6034317.1 AAA family ATPase [Candidatus Jacksonbacteria bacterium]MBT6301073.1 AAA family ATPase [Candidatus Jacksonbacteria bacterium]MBT6756930.1 AAA family ATPase [Candidatus Jacksonbacteria bacterium]MBT6955427.1 AAA family ATPase [Candidatus Jacksonbacteria bacterium]